MDNSILSSDIVRRARDIKLLLLDCDGVLTDGRLYFGEYGEVMKVFHVRDGQGLVLWHAAGFRSGIISGRNSEIVILRARELAVNYVRQGIGDKIDAFSAILAEANVRPDETAYVGDDVADVPLMERVGLSVAVADAVDAAKRAAHLVTTASGGLGAVREVTDLLLQAKQSSLMKSEFHV